MCRSSNRTFPVGGRVRQWIFVCYFYRLLVETFVRNAGIGIKWVTEFAVGNQIHLCHHVTISRAVVLVSLLVVTPYLKM